MKPMIGIIMRPELSTDGNLTYCGYKEIIDTVIKSGGIPLGIFPPDIENYYGNSISTTKKLTEEEIKELEKTVNLMDGIICQGGDDFYDYDIKVIKCCYKTGKPLLGICLGMQAMAYAFNGEIKDIGNMDHKQKNVKYVHEVNLTDNSILKSILGTNKIMVNSRHKSHIINTDLDVVATSPDGIIEAIEGSNHHFFIGVQWHPESMLEYDILMNRLFDYFIQKCK